MDFAEGYLLKWTNVVTRWQRRYFKIDSGVLSYSRARGCAPRGVAAIEAVTIIPHKGRAEQFSLEVAGKVLHLRCSGKQEAIRWI